MFLIGFIFYILLFLDIQIKQRGSLQKKNYINNYFYATIYIRLTDDLVLTLRGSFLPFRTGNIYFLINASTSRGDTTFLHLRYCIQIDIATVKLT